MLPPSLLKEWLLSDSIGRQVSLVIASSCLIGFIATLEGAGPNLIAALAVSGLIVSAIVLDGVRALSRRDPVYGLPLVWKGAFVVLAIFVTGIFVMVVLVLRHSVPVSELWGLLLKAGITEILTSTIFRRTDPRG